MKTTVPKALARTPKYLFLPLALLAGAAALADDGAAIYQKACVACHATGVANAPKFGDKAAWAPRAAAGADTLTASVVKGKGAMPPRAGAQVSDDDIRAAVAYMLEKSK